MSGVPGALRRAMFALACVVSLAGCETTGKKENIGAFAGAVIGGLAGGAFGSDTGQAVGIMAGVAVGAIVGSLIGKRLDEADRLKAERATQAALAMPKGETVEWKSEKQPQTWGTITTTSEPVQKAAKTCRSVREVVVIEGKEQSRTSEYCRSPDGRWSLAS